jgi:hypothetical protein
MSDMRAHAGVADAVDKKECLKKFEVHLTPPGVLERLCRGEHIKICKEAIYVEELLEIARALGRNHLVTTKKCRP